MLRRAALLLPLLGGLAGCIPPPDGSYAQQMPSQACDTSFRVVNESAGTVEQLYFSHSSMRQWGSDQLGQNVLAPGRAASYRAANPGAYDFRVVWSNGRTAELRGVDICRASTITVTNGGLRAS
jgi:hypothetical protein